MSGYFVSNFPSNPEFPSVRRFFPLTPSDPFQNDQILTHLVVLAVLLYASVPSAFPLHWFPSLLLLSSPIASYSTTPPIPWKCIGHVVLVQQILPQLSARPTIRSVRRLLLIRVFPTLTSTSLALLSSSGPRTHSVNGDYP